MDDTLAREGFCDERGVASLGVALLRWKGGRVGVSTRMPHNYNTVRESGSIARACGGGKGKKKGGGEREDARACWRLAAGSCSPKAPAEGGPAVPSVLAPSTALL
jgi:hypothetical protein